jgi:hypothetical protein
MGWVQIGAKSTQDVAALVGRRVRVRMPCACHGFRGATEPVGPGVDLALGRTGFVGLPYKGTLPGVWVVLAMLDPPEPSGLTWERLLKNPALVRSTAVLVDAGMFRTNFQIEGEIGIGSG